MQPRRPAVTVRPATAADLDAVAALLDGCARWLRDRGIRQWPVPFPRHLVATAVADGTLLLACHPVPAYGSGPVDDLLGTVRLLEDDPDVWGEQPPVALYAHMLAVARRASGRRLGGLLLDEAERHAAAVDRPLLRLDCWAGNPDLAAWYAARGFAERGVVEQRDGGGRPWLARRFERPVRRRAGGHGGGIL